MTRPNTRPPALALCLAVALPACGGLPTPDVAQLVEPDLTTTQGSPPPGSDPSACYARDVSPAVIETVTEQVIVQPAQIAADGTLMELPIYKTETRQKIVQDRQELWFQTPCSRDLTPDFVASLQRALAARGFYRGADTGEMDRRTRAAVRGFQKPRGLDSGILSMDTARELGLVLFDEAGGDPEVTAASADTT